MREDEPLVLKARYVFPVDRPPLADGVVTLLGERIVAVGENRSGSPPVDLGNVAILPGLINAHTHLEFSNLAAPLGTAGNPLPDWLRRVVSQRRASELISDPRHDGLAECARGGATSVGEIATRAWPETGRQPVADVTVFWEVIGLRPEQFDERLGDARAHLDRNWPAQFGARAGLSPHAPYSVHPLLVEKLVGLAAATNVPVAMHLAESREELDLLAHGSGAFRTLLDGLGVWPPKTFSAGMRVLDYLQRLAGAPRALVIHGNFLDGEEIDFLAARAAAMSVVFCPRTHAYFAHERYPLARMLARGVNVALGTDSRASNPDLSLLAELRFCARTHADVSGAKLLKLATLAGARAMGTDALTGSLTAGKLANLAVVALPEREAADPHDLVVDSELPVVGTWYRGRHVDAPGKGMA